MHLPRGGDVGIRWALVRWHEVEAAAALVYAGVAEQGRSLVDEVAQRERVIVVVVVVVVTAERGLLARDEGDGKHEREEQEVLLPQRH